MTIHGIKEDFKEEEQGKEKEKEKDEKEKVVDDFSDQETKEKEREKEKVILLKMKATMPMKNGKDTKMKIGMKAIGPMKMKQLGNPKAGMNGKSMMNTDISKEKERKERKEKGKGKKGHGPSEQGKGQGDGKGEENYVNPSHSSQPAVQQAALPSSASASGFFATHSDVSLTSVKVTQDEEQSMEPGLSGCAFLGQEANPVQKVEEEGVAFHTENQMPPTVAILGLGCTRAMGSRNAVNAFCDYVDNHDCGLWYKIEQTSSRFFFANSQQAKCTEKLVIHMYDKSWSVHTTEFDIVEEGNVPLLMSLPQMGNLGFQFELSPQKSFLNCTRLGIWKHQLRMAKSTHLVTDFQDIAWYMSAVYFKTPEVTSFFSQHEHFEYSQLSVETFAYATDDDWEIDYHRRELIRHHKTLRSQLFKISGSKCPISFDDLESTRTTFLEMKNGTKKVERDDWRAVSGPEKRFDKQWKGRTVFKIKAGVALPAEELSHVKSSSKPARISDPSDEVKPEHSSPEEKAGKSKPSSAPAEEGKVRIEFERSEKKTWS